MLLLRFFNHKSRRKFAFDKFFIPCQITGWVVGGWLDQANNIATSARVLRFLSKWIFVQVKIVHVKIVHVTLLSKWHYCPSGIIVQVTLLSKWQYCPSEYCPSAIIVQVNIVQVTLLSKSMYFTSRIVVK